MFPFIELFGKTISCYLLLSLIGAFIAGLLVCSLARKRGENDNEAIIVMLFSCIGIFVGGHIMYAITNINKIPLIFTAESFSQFLEYAGSVFGGSVFYGGLIGAIIAACITIRARKLSLPIYADMLATATPLFHAFARVGCFLGGCCYGIPSEFGFTAQGNTLVPLLNDVRRFPVQLLESALNLLIFFFLYFVYKKSLSSKALEGKILFIYLISYSVIRFFDEFLRGDEIRGFIFGISTSQFISILLFAISAAALALLAAKQKFREN